MLFFYWNKLFAYFLYGIFIVCLAQLAILAKLDQISVGLGDIKVDMSEVDFTWVVLLLPNWSKHLLTKCPSMWPAHSVAVTAMHSFLHKQDQAAGHYSHDMSTMEEISLT